MWNKQLQREHDPCCHRAAKRFKQQKKHLYLILDDWERGYGVYKIDVDDFDSSAAGARPEPLPEPPVVRFEARHGGSWYFAAHGTKILAMQPSGYPAFPVFDIQTAALAVCPWPRPGDNEVLLKPLFASVAGSLYLLRGGHFDVLSAAPPPPDSRSRREDTAWAGILLAGGQGQLASYSYPCLRTDSYPCHVEKGYTAILERKKAR